MLKGVGCPAAGTNWWGGLGADKDALPSVTLLPRARGSFPGRRRTGGPTDGAEGKRRSLLHPSGHVLRSPRLPPGTAARPERAGEGGCGAACGIAALRLREAVEAPCRPRTAQAGGERLPCGGSGRGCRPYRAVPAGERLGTPPVSSVTARPSPRAAQNLPGFLSYLIPCREAVTEPN